MIGTLSESPTHSYLKYYFEPNPAFHEQPVGSFFADILKPFPKDNGISSVEGQIYEIQTAQTYRLIPKLEAFLKLYEVVIVLPIISKKTLMIYSTETSEPTIRVSPLKQSFYSAFYEIYSMKRFLAHPNLNIHLCMIEVKEEITRGKTKKTTTKKTFPTALTDEILLKCPLDYRVFLPKELPDEFTSKDFAKRAKISIDLARTVLNILRYVCVIKQIGKTGNTLVYQISAL